MPVTGVNAVDLLINNEPAETIEQLNDSRYLIKFNKITSGKVNINWAGNTGIIGKNAFKKKYHPVGWYYLVDANAPPPPRIVITEIMYHPIEEPELIEREDP